MLRRLIAGLVVAGLAIGVWLLWPEGDVAVSTATTAFAAPTTVPATPTSSTPPAITSDLSTTSTIEDSHVVETVEEAEAILRELWFGWFEGIYNQDEDRIREVVATEEQLTEGTSLFGVLDFISPPTEEAIEIREVEILRSDRECLAVWVEADASGFRGEGSSGAAVYVLRRADDRWGFASSWRHRTDLWEADCEARL
jgi:hypothetical protein